MADPAPGAPHRHPWPGPDTNVAEVRTGVMLIAVGLALEVVAFLPGPRHGAAGSWAADACGDWRWFVWLVPFLFGATGLGLVLHGGRNATEERRSLDVALSVCIAAVLILGLVLFFSFGPNCAAEPGPGA